MTTSPSAARRPRRRPRPAPPAGTPTAAATAPGHRPPATLRPGGGCCRTWASEHISPGGKVVRTTWHEPACRTGGRP
ncbi:hypothetical protein [Kitasatospora sp. A2-31]|uniref:hypothetical protein n=1 Tax=Kitasatospora sp. A2-31 TaxID=2916414 RepID=UPI001EEE1FFE|nr:hypothetical protein [Kitasatospora sp. A2-31]MCG6499780.1 hypothetical protein [Kitasatospora sp. A2-31]